MADDILPLPKERKKASSFFKASPLNANDLLLRVRVAVSEVFEKGIPSDPIEKSAEHCADLIDQRGVAAVVQDMTTLLNSHLKSLALPLETYNSSDTFLFAIERVWRHFSCDILCWIHAIYVPLHKVLVKRDEQSSVINICLASFRDVVLLSPVVKANFKTALAESNFENAPNQLKQMIAIMLSHRLRTCDQAECDLKELLLPYVNVGHQKVEASLPQLPSSDLPPPLPTTDVPEVFVDSN